MYIFMCLNNGEILSNTLPAELWNELQNCNSECELKLCPVKNINKRQGKKVTDKGTIYLCSYDPDITNKIFKRHLILCESMLDSLIIMRLSVKEKESNKINRLEHNLVSYHKKLQEELDEVIPLEKNVKNWRDAIQAIQNKITSNLDQTAMSLLHILKYNKLIKAELDVYDLIDCDTLNVTFETHKIHKVINLAMQAFWIDTYYRRIKINIGDCLEEVTVDYASFSVVLGHIFDNATKYVFENSDINISFLRRENVLDIEFEMISILVEPEELDLIFQENYSGKWAKHYNLDGYGIGMYYAKKLTELNKGKIEFIPGVKKFAFQGIPYADNVIRISLNAV